MSHIVTTQALPSDTKLIRRYFALSNATPEPEPTPPWILASGTWNDNGVWNDNATWNDGV